MRGELEMAHVPDYIDLIYKDRLEDAEEFIYLARFGFGGSGVFTYTRSATQGCHKFACVHKVNRDFEIDPEARLLIADETFACGSFQELLAFLVEKRVLGMPSQPRMRTPSAHYSDLVGVKTRDNLENWYEVFGFIGAWPEHRDIVNAVLSGEEGQTFCDQFY